MTGMTQQGVSPDSTRQSRWLRFAGMLCGESWRGPTWVEVDAEGVIIALGGQPPAAPAASIEEIDGYAVPGGINAHSHAFQYGMAGLAEHWPEAAGHDDFWSWRTAMYRLAGVIDPEAMEALAAMAYAEMAVQGFTHVVEFHYLHHDRQGHPHPAAAEMSVRLMRAAALAGIGLTVAPVLYQWGGFGRPPSEAQKRFVCRDFDVWKDLHAAVTAAASGFAHVSVAAAAHSLRAVDAGTMKRWLSEIPAGPLHIHAAEQPLEVSECERHLGARPVNWLLDHAPDPKRLCIVHATHIDQAEAARLAASGAVVVICPSTEANLGDGLFPMVEYGNLSDRIAIGTDSHIGLSLVEELRWLEYGQRLKRLRRNTVCGRAGEDSGDRLYQAALRAGGRAAGIPGSLRLQPGTTLNVTVLDAAHPVLTEKPPERRLAAWIFGGDSRCLLGVMTRGRWVARGGRHVRAERLLTDYRQAMTRLRARLES